jgi:hypothetical protein
MGGAENANDLLSSKSCFKDVVVGISSSEIRFHKHYLRGDWRVGIVIIQCFYQWAWAL